MRIRNGRVPASSGRAFPCSVTPIFPKCASPTSRRAASGRSPSSPSAAVGKSGLRELKVASWWSWAIRLPESFAILAKFTENENRYIANWACEAISRHKNPEAMPYLEKAKERLGALDKIAGR